MPNTVYVGANRKIIAFSPGFVPRGEGLNAVLNGRIRTEPVKPDPASLREFANSGTVLLMAEPSKMQGFDDHKPKFPPSYEVHIAPSTTLGTMSTSAPDYWSVGGFDLKSIVAQAYGVEETHADFRDALKEKFNLKIASEDETLDVYVVTAPYGPGPSCTGRRIPWEAQSIHPATLFCRRGKQPTPEDMKAATDQQRASRGITVDSISVSSDTIEDFCKELENGLDHKVVDETQLTGRYDFNVVRGDRIRDEFFDMLREQFGLAVTSEQRDVPMLVVRSS